MSDTVYTSCDKCGSLYSDELDYCRNCESEAGWKRKYYGAVIKPRLCNECGAHLDDFRETVCERCRGNVVYAY